MVSEKMFRKGFTLIELVVAMAVFVAVTAMIFVGTSTMYRFKSVYDQETLIQRNFRVAVDRISQDMRSAVEYGTEREVIQKPEANTMGEELEFHTSTEVINYKLVAKGAGGAAPFVIVRNGQPITEEMNQLVELYFASDGRKVVIMLVGKTNTSGQEKRFSFTSLVYTRNTGFPTEP